MEGRTRRFRAGTQAPSSVAWSLFLVVVAAAFVAVAVQQHRPAFDLLAAATGLGGLAWLPSSLNGLRPVRVTTTPDVALSLPTFSLRHGYGRVEWAWHDVLEVELERVSGGRFPSRRLRVVGRSRELVSDSLTCSARRRHPERSRAGRAVAEIRQLLGCAGPW